MLALLLVADAAWVKNDVTAAVTDPGTSLDVVEDPTLAVAQAETQRYDAILVDMQVGSMGGMAVTRALHDAMSNDQIELAPVIMLLDRDADRFLARRAGADADIVKPFTSQDLREALTKLLPASSG